MRQRRGGARRWIGGAALVLAVGCGGSPSGPSAPGTGTEPQSPLDAAFALARQQRNITSLVVSHEGVIERQEYFNGGGADTPQDVRSVTKSVVSLLVGIAVARGCVSSVDQTVGELLGPLGPSDPAKAAVTLRHLLTMSSGIGGDELLDIGEYNRWWNAGNQLAHVWDQPMQSAPGAVFRYYSPAYHTLSPILATSCGQSTPDFARDHLFAPLGRSLRGWQLDRQGYANGAAGVMLTPMDMVAIGNMVLDQGRAGGVQVVPASWVADATRPLVPTTAVAYVSGYGYGWWTGSTSGSEFTLAHGWGGQFIVVVPRRRLVVTAASRWQGLSGNGDAGAQWIALADIIMRRIVPAF